MENNEKKIKVCYIISSLCNEGPVNILYGMLLNMDYNRFDISIITFNPEKMNSRINAFQQLPIQIVQLAKKKPIGIFAIYRGIKSTLKMICPEILHAHCPGSLLMVPLMPRRYKRVFTPHNFPGKYIRLIYGLKKGIIVQLITKIMVNFYDAVTCCSESVLDAYNRPKDSRFVAVPNGTTVSKWERNEAEKEHLREEFGLCKNVKYFIYVGRFASGKNIPLLAKVFDAIERNDVKIIMLGSGPLFDVVNKMNSKNIILPGFSTRVVDYLKAADYYISASDSEGMPNTLLENMSVGNPVLLSNIPAHREFFRNFDEEEVGCIIDQHNVDDMHRKIVKILDFDSDEVAKKMQEVFSKKYTAKVMSEQYQKVYAELLKN